MKFSSQLRRAALVAVAGGVLIASTLTGCSGKAASSGSGDGGSATEGNVTWWSWTPDNDLAAREIAAFNQDYPNIKVTYKKVPIDNYAAVLRPALASNDGPDVFTVNASGSFSGQTFAPYAYDLTPDITKLLGADWKSKIASIGVTAFTVKGRLVAAEWAKVGAGNMWINKETFDKYNVRVPTNLTEWQQACDTFRSHGLGCFREGLAGTSGFVIDTLHSIMDSVQPGLWTDLLAGKAKWTDEGVVQSLQILQNLTKSKILDAGAVGIQQYPDVNNNFLTGKVPMVQMGTWYQQYASVNSLTAALQGAGVPANTKKITIVPIAFPDVAGKGNPSTLFTDPDAGQAVNAKSKQRSAAVTFALWLGSTKNGQQVVANNLDEFPTLNSVKVQFDKVKLVNPSVQGPVLQNLTKQLGAATEARSYGIGAQLSAALVQACQQVTSGKSPADQVATVQAAAATGK
ncbi:MAG: ABC transporter substrate-binding protein [Janthinobacterium lividum]